MTARTAIEAAERVLPGTEASEGALDPRWQAIIQVAEHISDDPEAVWSFIDRWGKHADADLRSAIATCGLEHLLEDHFEQFFPRVAAAARSNANFADTVLRCWKLGQAESPANAARFDSLRAECKRRAG